MPRWEEQRDRMLRWYMRLDATTHDVRADRGSDDLGDEMLAFFETVLHMRDWVFQSYPTGRQRARIEKDVTDYFKSTEVLRVAGDVANGIKHLRIDREYIDKGTAVTAKHTTVVVGQGARMRWTIESAGRSWDAFDLATECVQAWDTYLTTRANLL
jgi:hypothetical protein